MLRPPVQWHDTRRSSPERVNVRATWRTGNRLRDPDVHFPRFLSRPNPFAIFAIENTKVLQTRIYHHPRIPKKA